MVVLLYNKDSALIFPYFAPILISSLHNLMNPGLSFMANEDRLSAQKSACAVFMATLSDSSIVTFVFTAAEVIKGWLEQWK